MKAALYARFSTDKQSDQSTADQLRLCRNRALHEGFEVAAEHSDDGISGSVPVASRMGGKALLADAMAGRFQALVIEGLDRLSRDIVEQETVIRRLEHRGIRIIGVSDGYDSLSKTRKLHRGMRGIINEIYLDDLRDKTHRGLSGVVSRGNHAGGLSYGYRSVPHESGNRLEIRDDQAQVVREIFDLFIGGWGPARIAARLNERGIPGPRGGTWAVSAIYGNQSKGCGILANELYAGRYIWNRSQWLKDPDTGSRIRVERPKEEWHTRECQELAIITRETWEAAKARMNAPRTQGGRKGRAKAASTLLGGLMTCGECGGSIIAVNAERYGCTSRKDRGKSVCSGVYFRRDAAEDRLLAGLRTELLSPSAMAELQAAVRELLKQRSKPVDHSTRLAELETEIGRLVDAIVALGSSQAITDKLKALESEKARLLAEQTPAMRIAEIPNLAARYRKLLDDLAGVLRTDTDRARTILTEMLGKVTIRKEDDGVFAYLETKTRSLLLASGFPEMVAGARFQNKIRLD